MLIAFKTNEAFFEIQAKLANMPNFPAKFAPFCQNEKSLKYIEFKILNFISP